MFNNLNLEELSEEKLIEILNEGNLSEDEFKTLIKAMENKGLKGTIMAVPSPKSAAGRAAVEYIEYHSKITDPKVDNKDIENFKDILLSREASLEDKKIALVHLAHLGRIDVYRQLEKYHQHPDPELKVWSDLALQECRSFLKSDLLARPIIEISKIG